MSLSVMTGASGHVGYALLKELTANNVNTRILIRKDISIFKGIPCEKVFGDVTDKESLVKAFEGADIVYHLAGLIDIKGGNEEMVRKINVEGTRNVVEACIQCGVKRLVYMSSVDVYIPLPGNEPMTEVNRFYPDKLEGDYAKTKAEATNLVFDAEGKNGLEVVVVYPGACFGPYDFKISSIGEMIRNYMDGKFPISLGFGGYNFVDVRDVAKGTYLAAIKGRSGEGYLLTGTPATVDEFIRSLARAMNKKPPKIKLPLFLGSAAAPIAEAFYKLTDKTPVFTRYTIRKLTSNYNFSYEKAKNELGYQPRPMDDTVKDTIKWIIANERSGKAITR